MARSLFTAAGTWLYSNKPHYPLLFVVCPHALRWSSVSGWQCFCGSVFYYLNEWKNRWHSVKNESKKAQNGLHEDAFGAVESAAASEVGILSSDGGDVEGAGMLGCYSAAAYVQMAIKVKDLQFSPAPQQPRTLLGITGNDLQAGWTVSLPKLQRLLGNQNHIIPH